MRRRIPATSCHSALEAMALCGRFRQRWRDLGAFGALGMSLAARSADEAHYLRVLRGSVRRRALTHPHLVSLVGTHTA
jgi:hypothetical protein